jgi:hypothetical protein
MANENHKSHGPKSQQSRTQLFRFLGGKERSTSTGDQLRKFHLRRPRRLCLCHLSCGQRRRSRPMRVGAWRGWPRLLHHRSGKADLSRICRFARESPRFVHREIAFDALLVCVDFGSIRADTSATKTVNGSTPRWDSPVKIGVNGQNLILNFNKNLAQMRGERVISAAHCQNHKDL